MKKQYRRLWLFISLGFGLVNIAQAAEWIWSNDNGPGNSWRCFRKEIDLNSKPEKAIAHIAADSKCWLRINGELVVFEGSAKRGPTPDGTYFDEVDISPYLTRGKTRFRRWFGIGEKQHFHIMTAVRAKMKTTSCLSWNPASGPLQRNDFVLTQFL